MKPRGVALVLVLAITGVVSLLILQISLTSQYQVKQARRLIDRTEAELTLHTNESALLYALLTRPRVTGPSLSMDENPYSSRWNFSGKAFTVENTSIQLQDLGGLFSMRKAESSPREFAALLSAIGFNSDRADRVSRTLAAHDAKSPGPTLQSIAELSTLAELSSAEIRALDNLATLYPVGALNPGTAQEPVLATRYTGSQLEALLAERTEGRLDEARWMAITGGTVDDMLTTFSVGPGFRVDLSVNYNGAKLHRRSVWTVRPVSESAPLQLWEYRNLGPDENQSSDRNDR